MQKMVIPSHSPGRWVESNINVSTFLFNQYIFECLARPVLANGINFVTIVTKAKVMYLKRMKYFYCEREI